MGAAATADITMCTNNKLMIIMVATHQSPLIATATAAPVLSPGLVQNPDQIRLAQSLNRYECVCMCVSKVYFYAVRVT